MQPGNFSKWSDGIDVWRGYVMCSIQSVSSVFSLSSKTLQTGNGDILVDYSKNLITEEVLKLLIELVGSLYNSVLCILEVVVLQQQRLCVP